MDLWVVPHLFTKIMWTVFTFAFSSIFQMSFSPWIQRLMAKTALTNDCLVSMLDSINMTIWQHNLMGNWLVEPELVRTGRPLLGSVAPETNSRTTETRETYPWWSNNFPLSLLFLSVLFTSDCVHTRRDGRHPPYRVNVQTPIGQNLSLEKPATRFDWPHDILPWQRASAFTRICSATISLKLKYLWQPISVHSLGDVT